MKNKDKNTSSQLLSLLSKIWPVIFILLAVIIGSWPFFKTGLYTAHDIWHNVARFYHYHQALSDGQFFPAWITHLANGYGYPLFLFSYHLPWLLGSVLLFLGMSLPMAFKGLMVLSFAMAGVTMYALAYEVSEHKLGSTLAALLYLIAPYHFLTMYVTASIGTNFVYAFLPLMMLGLYQIVIKKKTQGIYWTSLSYGLMVLSHLMTTVMLTPIIGFFAMVLIAFRLLQGQLKIRQVVWRLVSAGGLAFLLASFYLLPLVKNLSQIAASQDSAFKYVYSKMFVSFKQLIYSRWGFAPIVNNAKEGQISFQVGIGQWLVVFSLITFLSLVLIKNVFKAKKNVLFSFLEKRMVKLDLEENEIALMVSVLLTFVLSIFLMLEKSKFIWDVVTDLVSLDYPFRLLMVAVFFSSLSVVWVVSKIKAVWLQVLFSGLILAMVGYTNRNHIRVNQYTHIPISLYVKSETTTNTFHEYLPVTAQEGLLSEEYQASFPQDSNISLKKRDTRKLVFVSHLNQAGTYSLGQFQFPGIQVWLDGQKVDYQTDGRNLVRLKLPVGQHKIEIRYQSSLLMKASVIVSILTFFYLWHQLLGFIYDKKTT